MSEEKEAYEVIARRDEFGKTYMTLRGECGFLTRLILWSWAGHGFKRCTGCGKKLLYKDYRG